ncbi:MAG: ATP-dependent DNA ligase [Bryobacterales bacterium]|nr:ATP-dependent DNA ligase [Bryobacterales bacterium]
MLLHEVVETSERLAGTSKRLAKIDLVADLIRRAKGEEIEIAVAYLSGEIRQGRIGIGWSMLQVGRSAPPASSPKLWLPDVDDDFQRLGSVKGKGGDEQRRAMLYKLFSSATKAEQDFLSRLIMGELRQGALEAIVLEGVAKAAVVEPGKLRRAAMLAGELPKVARKAMEEGDAGLGGYSIELFRPVQPMLAQPAEDIGYALQQLGSAALEYKFDGARIQVHKSGDNVIAYSRSLKDVTAAIPEVVEAVRLMPARDLILDGEVLSFDEDGRPQPFQVTMRRFGRKLDVDRMRSELPVKPVWFDLLYSGGSMLDESQARRFAELRRVSAADQLVPHMVTGDVEQAAAFVEQALRQGHEGVMAKSLEAGYAAGSRGASWLKVKKARTLDLVILAAEWGNGRRRGLLSNLHLGARDTVNGDFAMLGKTFKGLTDEMLAWQTEQLLKLEIARDGYVVYVKPELVVEIAFNEIQLSSRYESGLALRFARVKRYRTDKTAEQADTFETVQRMANPLT